jgi:Glycosyl hydrolase family 99
MILSRLEFDEKLKLGKIRCADRQKKLRQTVGLSLLMMFVAFCTPRPSGLAEPAASPIPTTSSPPVAKTLEPASTPMETLPVLAYYYIWFDTESWDRAKTDFPLLGRYSSDDATVMRQHIQWAKEAGINGFIVSWKSAEKLNRRLDQLVEIADDENFKLAIIYEGLDFERNPLPLEQVDSDLDYFISRYPNDPVFDLFERPMLIWSGTWEFSTQEIASVVQDKRDQLLILASEKSVEGYKRLSGLVDGDAYYWSSVNPYSHQGYLEKLIEMSEAVHEDGGLWVAPAAPGFDARLVGGSRAIERRDGETLRKELNTAVRSSPDVIGLISWNEFSENSHVEPSQEYGDQYLEVIDEILPLLP